MIDISRLVLYALPVVIMAGIAIVFTVVNQDLTQEQRARRFVVIGIAEALLLIAAVVLSMNPA